MGSAAVRDVVRDVVAKVAPEELPVVDGLVLFDDATVVRRLRRGGNRRDPLGFGLGEIVVMVTPVVWLVMEQIAEKAAGAAVDGTAKGAKALLRKVFRKRSAPVVIPPLSKDQLAEVWRRVQEAALQRGMSEDRAKQVADEVVARLFLESPDSDESN
ncbi:hypothetical protein [Allokutzneria sp. NRRL B-24872]|uniref:hypothetical protein n=1 Tax=Allokutzneria sp. NRRL B-24872 TaxID=1137961 RepID=UPI000A388407|nr:hypothetical protein [Allokutzneria sp. NRRL B-24872]